MPVPFGATTNDAAFWDPDRETVPIAQRRGEVLERVRFMLRYAYQRSAGYRAAYDAAGVAPDQILSLDDFALRVPLVGSETDLPGDLCVPASEIRRRHRASKQGRSGWVALSASDCASDAHAAAQLLWASGVRPTDTVLIALPVAPDGLRWALGRGLDEIGATTIEDDAADPAKTMQRCAEARCTVLVATPNFGLRLVSHAAPETSAAETSGDAHPLRLGLFGAAHRSMAPATQRRLASGLGIEAVDLGPAPGAMPICLMPCAHGTGLHILEDQVYAEVLAPEPPYAPCPPGVPGTLVITTLMREAQPLIRYPTGLEVELGDAPCSCGRSYPLLSFGVLGRFEDLIVVSHASFYPREVEAILHELPRCGAPYALRTDGSEPIVHIDIEAEDEDPGTWDTLRAECGAALADAFGIPFQVAVHAQGTLPDDAPTAQR